jgi:hypothetical protein
MAVQASGGKGGNVTGALSSTDGDIAIFDGTTGQKLKDTNNIIKHLNIAYGNLTLTPVPPPPACVATLAGLGAGNVDNGSHIYTITFVTAVGETELGTASNIVTVVNQALDGKVSLTGIPIGPAGQGVTQRKIYRTQAGGTLFYFLATIPDNSTVTYIDNTADGGLGVNDATYRSNDTQWIYVDGTKAGIITNYNTILGINSGVSITTGSALTFLGAQTGNNNTIGFNNTFIGNYSGYSNITGNDNTFLGSNSGFSNIGGSYNIFVGSRSGHNNTTGLYNTFIGFSSGSANIGGTANTFIGFQSGNSNTIGGSNTFIGFSSGSANIGGNSNTFVGSSSGVGNAGGDNNTFLGYNSGYTNIAGNRNTFVGQQSGYSSTASDNTFIGYFSGVSNIGGTENTFVGVSAGHDNTTGSDNTFIGMFSGYSTIGGVENTCVGYQSCGFNTSGSHNTSIGYTSGTIITTGTDCVFLGHSANAGSNALIYAIAIGSGAVISNSNSWIIGRLGTKQNIFEGANAAMGTANLGAGGTILVGNNLVTANSRIFLTIQVPGGAVGAVYISARVPNTSFTISSTNAGDLSTVAWEIKEPA